MKIHGLYEPWIFYKGQSPVPTAIFYLNLDNDVQAPCSSQLVANYRSWLCQLHRTKGRIFPAEIYKKKQNRQRFYPLSIYFLLHHYRAVEY